jgi:anti-anti-sigma factor
MVKTEKVDGKLVCTFPERMDTQACEAHGPQLEAQIASAQEPITFDLDGVIYVASSFLRICLRALKTNGPERFAVKNVNPEVKKVFQMAGMDSYLLMR